MIIDGLDTISPVIDLPKPPLLDTRTKVAIIALSVFAIVSALAVISAVLIAVGVMLIPEREDSVLANDDRLSQLQQDSELANDDRLSQLQHNEEEEQGASTKESEDPIKDLQSAIYANNQRGALEVVDKATKGQKKDAYSKCVARGWWDVVEKIGAEYADIGSLSQEFQLNTGLAKAISEKKGLVADAWIQRGAPIEKHAMRALIKNRSEDEILTLISRATIAKGALLAAVQLKHKEIIKKLINADTIKQPGVITMLHQRQMLDAHWGLVSNQIDALPDGLDKVIALRENKQDTKAFKVLLKLTENIKERALTDPNVSWDVMSDPVMMPCGHVLDETTVNGLLETGRSQVKCPLGCKPKLDNKSQIPLVFFKNVKRSIELEDQSKEGQSKIVSELAELAVRAEDDQLAYNHGGTISDGLKGYSRDKRRLLMETRKDIMSTLWPGEETK